MPIHSMTGFGSAQGIIESWLVRAECRSVNHRSLESRVYLPAECRWLEPKMRDFIKSSLSRGRVELRIEISRHQEQTADSLSFIDEEKFAAVCRRLSQLAATNLLEQPVALSDIMGYRSYFERDTRLSFEPYEDELIKLAQDSVLNLIENRRVEGHGIASDLQAYIDTIQHAINAIEQVLPDERNAFQGRLEARLNEVLESFNIGTVDQERLMQEMVFYADRSDVAEELQRAHAHCIKLKSWLDVTSSGPHGKKADFYLQELMREANTLGSKNQASEILAHVIEIKSNIEKMREQVANIE